jgi:hypothetical protein
MLQQISKIDIYKENNHLNLNFKDICKKCIIYVWKEDVCQELVR